jgi:hypothetical protein
LTRLRPRLPGFGSWWDEAFPLHTAHIHSPVRNRRYFYGAKADRILKLAAHLDIVLKLRTLTILGYHYFPYSIIFNHTAIFTHLLNIHMKLVVNLHHILSTNILYLPHIFASTINPFFYIRLNNLCMDCSYPRTYSSDLSQIKQLAAIKTRSIPTGIHT